MSLSRNQRAGARALAEGRTFYTQNLGLPVPGSVACAVRTSTISPRTSPVVRRASTCALPSVVTYER